MLLAYVGVVFTVVLAAVGSTAAHTLSRTNVTSQLPANGFIKTRSPQLTNSALLGETNAASPIVQAMLGWLGTFYVDEHNNNTIGSTHNDEQQEEELEAVMAASGNSTSNSTADLIEATNRFLFPSNPFSSSSSSHHKGARDYAFDKFLNFEDLIDWYDTRMRDNNADSSAAAYVERQVVATTEEGRPVLVYKISSADSRRNSGGFGQFGRSTARPVLWMDGLIHAREWIAGSTVSYFYDHLLKDSKTDSSLRSILQKVDVWISPVMNPDGYAYTHSTDRYWRKNRQRNSQRPECPGIDLNRNWPAFFGQTNVVAPQSSFESCGETYAGEAYLTTREAKGVFDFLTANRNLIKVGLTFHSFGQVWLIPYGYSETPGNPGPKFPRYDSTYALFKPVVAAMHKTPFQLGNTVEVIGYAGGGGSDDTMAAMGICHVATVELPPGSGGGGGFDISSSRIIDIGSELWKGIRVLLKSMADTMTTSYCLSSVTTLPKVELEFRTVEDKNVDSLGFAANNAANETATMPRALETQVHYSTIGGPYIEFERGVGAFVAATNKTEDEI